MDDPNILDLDFSVFDKIRNILENRTTLQSFLEVLPPDCSREDVLCSMEIESRKYNMTPAKTLLIFLGNKGFRSSDLIAWFQVMGLEKALTVLKSEEALVINSQPQKEVKVKEGSELVLTCSATSYPPPEYQWFKDDHEILCMIDPVLSIKPVRMEDSGHYACLVTKWDSKKNAYDYLYSDFSNVEVLPQELHAISPCTPQEPKSVIHNPVQNKEIILSQQSFPPVRKECLIAESKSLLQQAQHSLAFSPETSVSSKPDIMIIKHPYVSGKVAPGMSLCLGCEAVSSNSSVNYQWFKNRRPLPGEVSSLLILNDLHPDSDTDENKWEYQCEVYNEFDRALSKTAVVELDETNDTTPYIATQKYAFMVANDAYENLENLQKPAADVKDLATILSSLGFKIFAFRNLTLIEMRNAFTFFCKTLEPGCYVVFFFAGHGFELYGQTYLQPVDSSDGCVLTECICSEYILQCLQEKKPALNVLLIDACRQLPANFSKKCKSQHHILPGRTYEAKMKNNTIYGYSTSFLYSSHESDEEANSLFVKHLKKHLTLDKCVRDILIMVQCDFAKDPVAKTIQFPVIESSLTEKRKLTDPLRNSPASTVYSDILNWCDIKREIVSKLVQLSSLKTTIVIEFHHHMEAFCNGMDVYIFLQIDQNANLFILNDMEINISFISPVLNVKPDEGVALKSANLLIGRRSLLLKKEVFGMQKLSTEDFDYNISLRFCSKNVTQTINCPAKIAKISELKLSLNCLTENSIEDHPIKTSLQI